jgi:hypothetical protein
VPNNLLFRKGKHSALRAFDEWTRARLRASFEPPTTTENVEMNIHERIVHLRTTRASVPDDEIEIQIEWNVECYLGILRESGLTMTEEQCRALARSDVAPTDEQLLGIALHAEFLERLEADCGLKIEEPRSA